MQTQSFKSKYSNSYFLTLTSILTLLIIVLTIYIRNRRKDTNLPPSPPALPIIGHLHLLRLPVHHSFHRLTSRFGGLVFLRLGSTPCLIAGTADYAHELLKTNESAFYDRPSTVAARHFAYGSAGFAFAPFGPYWRFVKKLCMSELLGSNTVMQLRPIRYAELTSLLQRILEKSKLGEPVQMSDELMKLTNRSITRMVATAASERDGEVARKVVKEVAELIGAFNIEDFIWFCKGLDLQGLNKKMNKTLEKFDRLLEGMIKEKEEMRRRKREKGGEKGESEVKDLMDILLDAAEDDNAEIKLTRENIKAFVMDIFTAGSDSSAATVEWAMSELINHPTILQKLRDEIDGVVGKHRLVDETDLPNLPYLNTVVKETFRVHPPAVFTQREALREVTIDGYTIPKHTNLFVNIWSVGRDPKYWENPEEFRPDRFAAGSPNGAIDLKGQNFQMIPFGSGRRGCPGILLAMQTVPSTLAALVQCFEWRLTGGERKVDMEEGIGLVSARAHPLVLHPVPRLYPFPSL